MKTPQPHAPLWALIPFAVLICAAFGIICFALLAPQGCDRQCMLSFTALGAMLGAGLGFFICAIPLFFYAWGAAQRARQEKQWLENERKRRKMEEIQKFWQSE